MYYNTRQYNIDNNYLLGQGWPEYRSVNVDSMEMNMNDDTMEDTMEDTKPRYDSEPGKSTDEGNMYARCENLRENNIKYANDMRLVRNLYTSINKVMYPFVEHVLQEYEYVGSPIYDDEGIDREMLAQLVDRVMAVASQALDEIQEIELEYGIEVSPTWDKNTLIRAIVESLVLSHLFGVKRPEYRAMKGRYVYVNGEYDRMSITL